MASVLSMTKIIFPIKKDEFALYTHEKGDYSPRAKPGFHARFLIL